jgi:hypothetical protein
MTVEEQVTFIADKTKDQGQYSWRSASEYDSVGEIDKKGAEAEGVGGREYYDSKWFKDMPCDEPRMDILPKFDVPGSAIPKGLV